MKHALVLLVEDNPDHADLVVRYFEKQPVPHTVCHLSDGDAALNYLFRRGEYASSDDSPRPDVILLDLRLPKKDGLAVLRQVKTSDELKSIPVVVLTTSDAEQDVSEAYECHANSYLVKPVNFGEFTELLNGLRTYWLDWNHQLWKPEIVGKCVRSR